MAVVCHDAGAANHIFAWIKSGMLGPSESIRPYVEGPARRLWCDTGLDENRILGSLEEALDGAQCLVSGTGWGSSLEHDARCIAEKIGIASAGVVDHWINYAERFERGGIKKLPSEIWVTDEYALALATQQFPELPIYRAENAYVCGLVSDIKEKECYRSAGDKPTILYALEPARSAWGRCGKHGEFQGLDYFLSNIECLGLGKNPRILLRPHPSDEPGKYDAWIARNLGLNISLDCSATLAEAIAKADCVVGLQTYVLVIALAAGKKALSTLPPWGPSCSLPHPDIIRLKEVSGCAG